MGQPLKGREAVSVGVSDDERSVSVTGVGVPNVLLTAVGELERGDVLGARYQIEAVIGTGGSGRVLRAFDRESRMPVALKILRPEFASDPVWTERFSRELRIGRTITHPNVCRVFDIGDADGHKFLSMELASRGSIRADVPKLGAARVTPTRPLRSWAERVADAQAVVDGVAALHAAGIVHRDLKPENILRMEDGRLVVTDFGLATDPDAHGNTVMVGTPSYMAPEVVMGDPATKRSDVWGLGVVLHEILFGCRPQWKAAGRGYRKFVLPDEVTNAIQRAVADLCGRCADDSGDLRPASAVELRDEWARALRGKGRLSRARTRQIAWGAVAVAAFAALAVVRDRWSNRAEASLSNAASSIVDRVLTPTGTPEDWSKGAQKLASFAGRVHCYSMLDGGRRARVVWGSPKKAEDIDVATGKRSNSALLPETYRDGCPILSPDGRRLLFEKSGEAGPHIFLSQSGDGARARPLVRGSSPEWLPGGQEFIFEFDAHHVAHFSVPSGQLNIIGDDVRIRRNLAEKVVDTSGHHLAIRYFTGTIDNLLVIHSLPTFEVEGTFSLPPDARKIAFSPLSGDQVLLAMIRDGREHLAAADWRTRTVRWLGGMPQEDLQAMLGSASGVLLASRRLKRDLWLPEDSRTKTQRRLTTEGDVDAGSISKRGDVVSQRLLPSGAYAIFLSRDGSVARQVTDGPLDFTPSFLPNGQSFVFARYSTKQIIECDVASLRCSAILQDSQTPMAPVADPSGRYVAFFTLMNIPRLHVLDRAANRIQDLGVMGGNCAPFWTSSNHVWTMQVRAEEVVWTETDTRSGQPTGIARTVPHRLERECALPADLVSDVPIRAEVVIEESSDFWRR